MRSFTHWLRVLLYAPVLVVCAGPALAQQAAPRPVPIDPGQSEKSFDAEQERRRFGRPPVAVPSIARPQATGDTKPLFVLKSVAIEGAIAIPAESFSDLYASLIGRKVSQADLLSITNGITERYRAEGFHLSRAIIPPQDIKRGRIRVQVIEGSFTELEVAGNDDDTFGVRKILGAALNESPSRLSTLERQLLIANDIAGVRVVDTAIDEIGTATGRFRLIVKLKTWRAYTSIGTDTYGTRATGPWTAYSTAALNSTIAPGDSLAVNLSTVPDSTKELKYGRVSYDIPVGIDGAKLGGSFSRSEVWPGDIRQMFDDHTINRGYELRGSIAPLQTRKATLTLSVTGNWNDPYEKTSLGYLYEDHTRQVSVAADFRALDPLNGWNYATFAYRRDLAVFGATQQNDPMSSRFDASPNASIYAYSYVRLQPLIDPWSLKAGVSGQFASGPLLNSQTYYLGGAAFGPGYVNGDNGYSGNVELRFDQKPQLPFLKGYQLYAFVDGGRVWNMDSERLSVASAGAGIRILIQDDLTASFAVAAPVYYSFKTDEVSKVRFLFAISSAIKWCPSQADPVCT